MYYTRKRMVPQRMTSTSLFWALLTITIGAVLACNFCRQRKRKCDGKKPCTTCMDSSANCVYQELPIDRTEENVLPAVTDRLSRIEALLEQHSQQFQQLIKQSNQISSPTDRPEQASENKSNIMQLPLDLNPLPENPLFLLPKNHRALNTTLLALPQVQEAIGEFPPNSFIHVEEKTPLPGLLDKIHDGPLVWPVLVPQTLDFLAASYFQHVHPHQPLFTPWMFKTWQMTLLEARDLDRNATAICLCVYALGALTSPHTGHQKAADTLGLEYFQPALKMISHDVMWGFNPGILSCQALLLAASYFAHLGRPVHSLRMSHFASRKFIGLLESRQCNPAAAEFDDTELRIFWQCFMVECDGVAEFDTSRSGIEPLGDTMPLPHSLGSSDDRNHIYSITEHAIRRLLNRIISALYDPNNLHRLTSSAPNSGCIWQSLGLPKLLSISAELDRQLEQWYHSIPSPHRFPKGTAFLPDDRARVLRTRYYMARNLIYRPFLLQSVSCQWTRGQSPSRYPPLSTDPFSLSEPVVLERCQTCIESCMAYLYNAVEMIGKRSPYLWTFSQNCIAALILLWLAQHSAPTSHLVPTTRPIQGAILDKLQLWSAGNPSFEVGERIVAQLKFSGGL